MTDLMRALSLGAGVQSTTVGLLCADGELPPIQHAIFADTGWEPRAVYEHLERLSPVLAAAGIEVHVVTSGNIRSDALDPTHRYASMPLYIKGEPWTCPDCDATGEVLDPEWRPGDDPEDERAECPRCRGRGGSDGRGIGRRQCTSEYKLKPIKECVRKLLGATVRTDATGRRRVGRVPGKPGDRWVENYVGISADEVQRIKPSDVLYMRRVDPLVDLLDMSRDDCEAYLADRWPWPVPRSACIGCPFHTNLEWRTMRDDHPEEWADAIDFDRRIRGGGGRPIARGDQVLMEAFLHADLVPLAEADVDRIGRREWQSRQGTLPGCSPFGCQREGDR